MINDNHHDEGGHIKELSKVVHIRIRSNFRDSKMNNEAPHAVISRFQHSYVRSGLKSS